MIWLAMMIAAYSNAGLATDGLFMEFRCSDKALVTGTDQLGMSTFSECSRYDQLVIYDSKGQRHIFKLVDVQEAAIKELKKWKVKEEK